MNHKKELLRSLWADLMAWGRVGALLAGGFGAVQESRRRGESRCLAQTVTVKMSNKGSLQKQGRTMIRRRRSLRGLITNMVSRKLGRE